MSPLMYIADWKAEGTLLRERHWWRRETEFFDQVFTSIEAFLSILRGNFLQRELQMPLMTPP